MSGLLLDTNSVIYFFNGEENISNLIERDVMKKIYEFLREVEILYIDDEIITNTIDCRKNMKLKLPDAIIAATAKTKALPLVTADKSFQKVKNIRIISPI